MRGSAVSIAFALSACGRVGFDAHHALLAPDGGPDTPLGHDEDGDGVPDALDVCPHLPGSQLDSDGDGIGDDCDPEPMNPRQHVLLFATLQPGDQPLTTGGGGTWTQNADALSCTGMPDCTLQWATPLQNVAFAIGVDVTARLGDATVQHQVAMGIPGAVPYYFVELDDQPSLVEASITKYDSATGYSQLATQPLPSGVHTGAVFEQITMTAGATPTAALDGGWPGEPYHLTAAAPGFAGGAGVTFVMNNLVADVRYAWVVGW